MPAYQVERSVVINADPETVFDTVADFGTWTTWSPWLGIDKDAVVTVSDDPRSVQSVYQWSGELVGQGAMEHVELSPPNSIIDELRIAKPFKSRSKVTFRCTPDAGGTRLTWTMDGNLPWFLFFMKGMMKTFIGMDYERGLRMVRELIETGTVLSETEIVGIEDMDARQIMGVRAVASTDDVGPAMRDAFDTVNAAVKMMPAAQRGMMSAYHPCDLKQGKFDFTAGYAVGEGDRVPDELTVCHIPAGRFLHVRHTGCYNNLGNAWSGAHQYARYKKIKLANRESFETYANSAETTAAEDLVTDIYLPLK